MDSMKSGQLMWKKEIEKRYGTLHDEQENLVSFLVHVKVKGLSSPIVVRVFAYLFEETLLQLWDYKIEYASANLGEKRMDALCFALKEIFYEKETLFAPIEHPDFFIFGYHYAFEAHYYTRPVVVLKKKECGTFELLAREIIKKEEKETEMRYFYAEKEQLVLQHVTSNAWEEKWRSGKITEVLYDLQSRVYRTTQMILDEKGHIYQSVVATDPNNIRLFTLKRNGKMYPITSALGFSPKAQTYTYREALEEQALYEDTTSHPFYESLPFGNENLTIFSPRIIGASLPDYPIGTWVKTKEGKNGVTTSLREGQSYEVCLEDDYLPQSQPFSHDALTTTPNPCTRMEKPLWVHYRLRTPRHIYYGFGQVMEERPFVYKLKPMSKYEKNTTYLIQMETIIDLLFHRRTQEEAFAKMKKIHGEDIDFLFIPKEDVTILSEAEATELETFLQSTTTSSEQIVFENLLSLQKLGKINWDYVMYNLSSYTEFESMTTLMKKLTQCMLMHKDEALMEACAKWFMTMDVKKRLKSTS